MGKSFSRLKRLRRLTIGFGAIIAIFSFTLVGASSANISHSYKAGSAITNGSIISLDPNRSDYVQLANSGNSSRLLGVAVNSSDSLLAVDTAQGTVQIATSGNAAALVSTVNGNIGLGDQIGLSPFNGVGMKAAPGSRIIGLAQTTLDGHTEGSTTQGVTDKQGKSTQIRVGLVRISIAIGMNSDVGTNTEKLTGLQKVGQSITGHTISTARLLISLLVAVVSLLALITLIYASIYGSILSVGRNPLAKYAIFQTLGSVLGMAVLTAVVAGVTLFLLLR